MVQMTGSKFTFKTTFKYTPEELSFDCMFRSWAESNGWTINGFCRGLNGGHVIVSGEFDNKASLDSACIELFGEVMRLTK